MTVHPSAQSDQSSLWAQWVAKDPSFLHVDSKTLIRQADLSLRWAHMPFCWFCHEAAQVFPTRRTQRILRYIRPVWSESSLWAQWVTKDPSFLHVDSKTLIRQADLSLRWAHMPFCWFCHEAAQVVPTRRTVIIADLRYACLSTFF